MPVNAVAEVDEKIDPIELFRPIVEAMERRGSISRDEPLVLPKNLTGYKCLFEMKLRSSRTTQTDYRWVSTSDSSVFADDAQTHILHVYPKQETFAYEKGLGINQGQLDAYYGFVDKMQGIHSVSAKGVPWGTKVQNIINKKNPNTISIEILPPPTIIPGDEASNFLYSYAPFAEGISYHEACEQFPKLIVDINEINKAVRNIEISLSVMNPVESKYIHHVNLRVLLSSDKKSVEKYIITDLADKISH